MDKVHRREGDLAGAFRQIGRTTSHATPSEEPDAAEVKASSITSRSRIKALMRMLAVAGWRLIRPFVRGPVHRLRSFLIEPQRVDLFSVRDALRQDIINTQTWAYGENQVLAATLAREILSVREAVSSEVSLSIGSSQHLEARLSELEERVNVVRTNCEEILGRLDRIEAYSLKSATRQAVPVGRGRIMVRSAIGYMVCEDTDSALLAQLLEAGELESGTRLFIESFLRPGMTFVDVGANIGMHSVAAGKALGGIGRIVAFEPFPATASLLDENIWNNGVASLCEVHPVALAASAGERILFLGRTSGHHSLFPLDIDEKGGEEVRVTVATLDGVLGADAHVDIVKIDAEGAELDVIRGARGILESNRNIALIVEFGASHLARSGIDAVSWIAEFTNLGFGYKAIDDASGIAYAISVEELIGRDSVNLFFSRGHLI